MQCPGRKSTTELHAGESCDKRVWCDGSSGGIEVERGEDEDG